jgi:preprotein translocase subunit SecD
LGLEVGSTSASAKVLATQLNVGALPLTFHVSSKEQISAGGPK